MQTELPRQLELRSCMARVGARTGAAPPAPPTTTCPSRGVLAPAADAAATAAAFSVAAALP